MITQHRLMAHGIPYFRAEREAIRVETRERNRSTFSGVRQLGKVNPELQVRKRVGPLEIWIVDGRLVRKIDPRFCVGGHDMVYGYVPNNHIWLEKDTPHRDLDYNEVHEMGERKDMTMGYSYPVAHAKWSRIQTDCYHDKNELLRQMKLFGLVDAAARRGKYGNFVVSEAL